MGDLLTGETLLGFGDLKLARQPLFLGHSDLIAPGQLRNLLLECGSLFGLFLFLGFQRLEFFFGHYRLG